MKIKMTLMADISREYNGNMGWFSKMGGLANWDE